MPRFRAETMDSAGQARTEHVQAASADEATRRLRAQGLFVVTLKEVSDRCDEPGTPEPSGNAPDVVPSTDSSGDGVGPLPGRRIGAIVTAVGLACAAIGVGGVVDSVWSGLGSKRATAIVVERRDEVDRLAFAASGRQYRVEARGTFGVCWGNSAGLKARVDVLYPPDHPENARLAEFTPRFAIPLILLTLGVAFTPCGVLVLRRGLRLSES